MNTDNRIESAKRIISFYLLFLFGFIVIGISAADTSYAAKPKDSGKRSTKTQDSISQSVVDMAGSDDTTSFSTFAAGRFIEYYKRGIQEKLFLHTDKPFYAAGEKIWFKGYVVQAFTHVPSTLSGYIYVELINNKSELVERVKVRSDSLYGFYNCIDLKPATEPGDYTLRAYTRWMQNEGAELFFSRNIRVENPLDDRLSYRAEYELTDKGKVRMKIRLTNSLLQPYARKYVTYNSVLSGRKTTDRSIRTDNDGFLILELDPPADTVAAYVTVGIEEEGSKLERLIALPAFSEDFDVAIMPEGGVLVPGILQTVGFKAVASNGLGSDVTGELYDGEELLAPFSSLHKGMGKFSVVPVAGSSLRVVIKNAVGFTKEIMLPVEEDGCPLQVVSDKNRVLFKANPAGRFAGRELSYLIHSGGKMLDAGDFSGDNYTKIIPKQSLPEGVMEISVLDRLTRAVISKRLVYVRNPDLDVYATISGPVSAKSREKVTFDVDIKDGEGNPVPGQFSISVTDGSVVPLDPLMDNIKSYIDLTSNLKGHIEDPGYYFGEEAETKDMELDLLMLTQGWCRFDVSQIMSGDLEPYKIPIETELAISGSILGFFGGKASRPNILFMDPQNRFTHFESLNKHNRFTITGIDVCDTTTLFVQALNRRGKSRTVELKLDRYDPPKPYFSVVRYPVGKAPEQVPQSYLSQSQTRYYMEGGMRVVDLEAVEVKSQPRSSNRFRGTSFVDSREFNEEFLSKRIGMDLLTLLTSIYPGLTRAGFEGLSYRNNEYPPAIYYDNFQIEVSDLYSIAVSDIKNISFVRGGDATLLRAGSSGLAILIESKMGEMPYNASPLLSIAKVSDLGYRLPQEFYQPKYEIRSQRNNPNPDMRTTIAWDPKVVAGEDGKAVVTFWTADKSSVYNIELQGITDDGRPCVATTTLRRE